MVVAHPAEHPLPQFGDLTPQIANVSIFSIAGYVIAGYGNPQPDARPQDPGDGT
jgi:hypothetical protein